MGILNITPDSFYDGGKYFNNLNKAIDRTNQMIKEGADIIDIGGESTRPGYKKIHVDEELNRVIPVIEEIVKRFDICISVDTSKPKVMMHAAQAGAHIINDIEGLNNKESLNIAIKTNLLICIVYNDNYLTQYNDYNQKNTLKKTLLFFENNIKKLKKLGIKKNRLIIDPGFGFKKYINDNYYILSNLRKLKKFNLPILVGISRKKMIRKLLNTSKNNSLIGSLIFNNIACMEGAKILRVHDVLETNHVIKILKKYYYFKNYKHAK